MEGMLRNRLRKVNSSREDMGQSPSSAAMPSLGLPPLAQSDPNGVTERFLK